MRIEVRVKTGLAKQSIERFNEIFLVRLRSRPENDKANIELIKLLARYFKIDQKNIKIVVGRTSSKKILEIKG